MQNLRLCGITRHRQSYRDIVARTLACRATHFHLIQIDLKLTLGKTIAVVTGRHHWPTGFVLRPQRLAASGLLRGHNRPPFPLPSPPALVRFEVPDFTWQPPSGFSSTSCAISRSSKAASAAMASACPGCCFWISSARGSAGAARPARSRLTTAPVALCRPSQP